MVLPAISRFYSGNGTSHARTGYILPLHIRIVKRYNPLCVNQDHPSNPQASRL